MTALSQPNVAFWLARVAVILFVTGADLQAQDDVSIDLDTIRTNCNMPGISAMVIKQGRILAQGAAGFRRQGDNTPLLVTDDMNIGSCTKWMTATLAGRLIDKGIIRVNTRVRDSFENYANFDPAFWDATLDQFLAHRTGVQSYGTFKSRWQSEYMLQAGSRRELRRWVSDTVLTDPPEVSPGTFLYANQGYAVAACMMENATGKDWETLIEEEVFRPLRMTNTYIGVAYDAVTPPKGPVGHDLNNGTTVPVPVFFSSDYIYHDMASCGPAGDVVTTLRDWSLFLHMHMTSDCGDYLSSATAEWLKSPYTGSTGYGRGVQANDSDWASPLKSLAHSGDHYYQDTLFRTAPALDLIVLVFVNCTSDDGRTWQALSGAADLLMSRYVDRRAEGPLIEKPAFVSTVVASTGVTYRCHTLPGLSYMVQTSSNLVDWLLVNNGRGQTASNLITSHVEANVTPISFARMLCLPALVPANMTLIPAGSFVMGDALNEDGAGARPTHTVQVSGFYIDKYALTKPVWDRIYAWAITNGYVFGANASSKDVNHPAYMQWYDAVKWCNARSEYEGRPPAYYTTSGLTNVYRSGDINIGSECVAWQTGYRLPTEAEWERAARGGEVSLRFPWGNEISWGEANYCSTNTYAYDVNGTNGYNPVFCVGGTPYTCSVGSFQPNGYGLYDMAGNVYQWCWDWYGSYSTNAQVDPRGAQTGTRRVMRGGGWISTPNICLCSHRGNYSPNSKYNYIGMRVVLPTSQ